MSDNVRRLVMPRGCNEAIDESLDPREERAMIAGAAKKIEELLDTVIGIFPDGKIIGLSKYDRVVDHFARRSVRASYQSRMVNAVFLGALLHDNALKHEFLQECRALERTA
jgi:hypothetical protein